MNTHDSKMEKWVCRACFKEFRTQAARTNHFCVPPIPPPTIEKDPIKHPSHYTSHPSGVECITIAQHHNFNIGNAIKYLWRQGLKEGEPSEKDLLKAKQYIEFELARIKK